MSAERRGRTPAGGGGPRRAPNRTVSSRRTADTRYGGDLSPQNTRRRKSGDRLVRPSEPRRSRREALGALGRNTLPFVRAAVLAAEAAAVLLLLNTPALASHRLDVSGVHHLTRQRALDLAGLNDSTSVFMVTTEEAAAGLRADPWVRDATVRAVLPDRVTVEVVEWQPLGVITRGQDSYLVNEEGNVLGRATDVTLGQEPGQPRIAVVQENGGGLAAGQNAINRLLLENLRRVHDDFPSKFGLDASRLVLQAGGQLVIETALPGTPTPGPRILFGQMVTEEQIASLDEKLAALNSLKGQLDLGHARLEYINLENPRAPATGTIPSPSPSPRPSASASPKR